MRGFSEIFGWKESQIHWATVSEPTCNLRIVGGKLQQEFLLKRHGNGILDQVTREWRPVQELEASE